MAFSFHLRAFVLIAVLVSSARATSFCQQVVEPLGYDCEEFTVETSDGFVLVLHRLSQTGMLAGIIRPASPAGAPAPAADVEALSPAPSSMVLPPNSSIYNISAHFSQAPKIRGNRKIVRSSSNSSSDLPQIAPSPASSANHSSNSTSSAGQRINESGFPSNYTVHSGVRSTVVLSLDQLRALRGLGIKISLGSTNVLANIMTNVCAVEFIGKGSPVLLLHQEFVSGGVWFEFADGNRTVGNLLPIMLLNDGFDVWIGHSRATYWCHGHVHLTPTDREYWNWTWDQHVEFDLPAQLLFISTETNQPVHFIGASQAAAVGAAAATFLETAQMIRSLTLIGPTAYRGYTNSLLLEAWAYYFGLTLDSEYYISGYQAGAFNYSREFPQSGPFSAQGLTNTAINLIAGPNCCLSNSVPIQFTNGWDGTTSFKNLLHWQQGIRSNTFAHYDYGNPARNMEAYGRPIAPNYNVAQIPRLMPVFIIAGGQDYEAPPHGIKLLLSQLQPGVTSFLNLTRYAHYDLGFSMYREQDIYLPILKYLEGAIFS